MRKKGIGVIYSLEELSKVKDCVGLIAFLHNPRGTHAGFASDLIEPARPHLTRFVADIWKNFKSSDFEKADDAVFLRKEAMQTFLNLYSLQLQSLSDLMSQTLWKVFSDSQHVCQEEEG